MAAPNIISANTINGKTTAANLTSTAAFTVLNNPGASGKVLKINTLNAANYTGNAVTVSIFYSASANLGGANNAIIGSISVPGNSTLNVIDKSSQYYLEENTSIGAASGTANSVSVTVSYEDIS